MSPKVKNTTHDLNANMSPLVGFDVFTTILCFTCGIEGYLSFEGIQNMTSQCNYVRRTDVKKLNFIENGISIRKKEIV